MNLSIQYPDSTTENDRSSPLSPLFTAVLSGKMFAVTTLLDAKIDDPNEIYQGKTMLYWAVEKNAYGKIQALIADDRTDPNKVVELTKERCDSESTIEYTPYSLSLDDDIVGETPLCLALRKNDLMAIYFLLQSPKIDVEVFLDRWIEQKLKNHPFEFTKIDGIIFAGQSEFKHRYLSKLRSAENVRPPSVFAFFFSNDVDAYKATVFEFYKREKIIRTLESNVVNAQFMSV